MREESLFPLELVSDIPRITLCGRQTIQIEQHKGLLAFQQEDISLMTGSGILKIHGNGLSFKHYSASDAIVFGEIDSIHIGEGSR